VFGCVQLRAEDAQDRAGTTTTTGDLMKDVSTFLADKDHLAAQQLVIQGDRDTMAGDLQNAAALETDVKKFFDDRHTAGTIDVTKAFDRKQVRIDLQIVPTKLSKPTPGSKDVNQDAAAFIKDRDARIAAKDAFSADIENMRFSLLQGDKAGVTTNGNLFFADRHSFFQARLQVNVDVAALKKDVKFKGVAKPTAPVKGNELTTHATTFLNDRAKWIADQDRLVADINNLRAVLGTGSIESAVTAVLTDRHQLHVDEVQLALDRQAMRADVGLSKGEKALRALKFSGGKGKVKASKEDDSDSSDQDLDVGDDAVGEK
jgi:hypothetical protein